MSIPALHPLPRPEGEVEQLREVWRPPGGVRFLTVVNNTYIGIFYIGTALLFFLLAGVLALAMRTQLAIAENDFLSQDAYNQFFTMHGTIMMFLFAVPAVEAMGVYLLPAMLGARDLPFPRLSAYAFWAYFVGGLLFFCSLFFDLAPRGGWFMYPPLTMKEYSPGIAADFWLLGIGFIEISAIAGAVEIIVGVLRTRAPGMSLDKLPIYAWAMLVFAFLIMLAFPAIIVGTALLELQRAFGWPFFDAARGGDPLLWQHLFWFFGHPEVYIIFLPAAGFVSMILPTMCGVPLAAYRLVVIALLATGFAALGVWVHHMFATGIPALSISFFSAASMAVAVPSGIQVFAWIATLARGRVRITVPTLFVLGFLFIFVLGGLTGVMVGLVPFDWQVHDTFFVVAHFHYVLIGGMVFPLFGAFYYWAPTASLRPLSERLGRWVFWLLFLGFNVAFFPMHVTGLLGMPRRVWTYSADMGWEPLNLLSTAGAYGMGVAVAVFLVDLARNFRPFHDKGGAGDVWSAGTLEWIENSTYGVRSIPVVDSRDPLWAHPDLADCTEAGAYFLPGTATGTRETLVTSPLDGRPEYVVQLPGPSWKPFVAAIATALAFYSLTLEMVLPAFALGALTIAAILAWVWDSDRGPARPPVDVGGGHVVPTYAAGRLSHAWWGVAVLVVVVAMLFAALFFSYLYLRLVSPDVWPAATGHALPAPAWPIATAALLLASGAAIAWAGRALARRRPGRFGWDQPALVLALAALVGAFAVELVGQRSTGLVPQHTSYAAVVYALIGLQGALVFALTVMGLYTLARSLTGRLGPVRRVTFDNTRLLWSWAVVQGLVMTALLHGAPRILD
ncbi:MAG: cytochrome ubiquinol oxidase subunit I [Proteobacteria bacterium]|nr:MAG: cytochrome ubiquinol oxidase subunit I [Pseudomonadota bacterium]